MAMNLGSSVLPNIGSHAWLHRFERRYGLRIGDPGPYPLPPPAAAFPVHIEQRIGFSCEPRAYWHEADALCPPRLEWSDFGVFSPVGPMPEHFTESILNTPGGMRLARFVGDLTQRLSHLYYRGWAQLRPECESGRADNRFAELLNVLAGGICGQPPHLAWHRPKLAQLPYLVARFFGATLGIEHIPVSRVAHECSICLGNSRLGQGMLGTRIGVFGAGLLRIVVRPQSVRQFANWRTPGNSERYRLEQLIHDCLPTGSRYELRLSAPPGIAATLLGRSSLGASCLGTQAEGAFS